MDDKDDMKGIEINWAEDHLISFQMVWEKQCRFCLNCCTIERQAQEQLRVRIK